jgi:hypothetical protein
MPLHGVDCLNKESEALLPLYWFFCKTFLYKLTTPTFVHPVGPPMHGRSTRVPVVSRPCMEHNLQQVRAILSRSKRLFSEFYGDWGPRNALTSRQ